MQIKNEIPRDPDLEAIRDLKKEGRKIIGVVSRLSPEKRVDMIIRHYKNSGMLTDEFCLIVLGEGFLREDYEKEFHEVIQGGNVLFLSKRRNIQEYFQVMDVFVHASAFEGLGMVYLEAMYFGLPIVTSRNDAAVELFGDSSTVVFFDFSGVANLKDAITEVTAKNRHILIQDYKLILDRFDWSKTANSYLELYRGSLR